MITKNIAFLVGILVATHAYAAPCMLTGTEHLSGSVKLNGTATVLPTDLAQCVGKITEGSALVIYRNTQGENQSLILSQGDDLSQAVKNGKSTSTNIWSNVAMLLRGDKSSVHGSQRMGEEDTSGFPSGTILNTGSDVEFDIKNAGLQGDIINLVVSADDDKHTKVFAQQGHTPIIKLPRRMLHLGTRYNWSISTNLNENATGYIQVISDDDTVQMNGQIKAIENASSTPFAKAILTALVYDDYDLSYDKQQIIRKLNK
jgi:hypothetical protein